MHSPHLGSGDLSFLDIIIIIAQEIYVFTQIVCFLYYLFISVSIYGSSL